MPDRIMIEWSRLVRQTSTFKSLFALVDWSTSIRLFYRFFPSPIDHMNLLSTTLGDVLA
jgi:hypothetical protein